jgi:hypothetical protein
VVKDERTGFNESTIGVVKAWGEEALFGPGDMVTI